uniref:Predicted protein n=1 Tax=Physcomitrium patens TaxID=3218 RepID=A9U3C4_PHYPA
MESAASSLAYLLKPLTKNKEGIEELGIPLDIFSIRNTSDPNKIGYEDWHKSLANKDQFRVYQNLSFSPHIQLVKLFGDNNSQLGRPRSPKKTFARGSFYFNKELSRTSVSLMTSGGPIVPIAVQMGAVGDRMTSITPLPTFRGLLESYLGRNDYDTIPQGIVDVIPLQAVPPSSSHPYAPYLAYQKSIPTKELPNELVSRDPNESLLLTLTEKMDELVVNLAKDKEKRYKPTNMLPNVWCSNCKGQGHLVTEYPSPPQMTVQCIFCWGKHITTNY